MDKLRITKTLETIRAVKSKYFNKGIYENSGNVRETWKVINSMLRRNTTTTLISECSLKAVKINRLFCLLEGIGQEHSSSLMGNI